MKSTVATLVTVLALTVTALGTQQASASLVTFTYNNPNAVINITGRDFGNTLGLGYGDITGRTVSAFMTLTFDQSAPASTANAYYQLTTPTLSGVSGSASINGHAVATSFPGGSDYSEASIYKDTIGAKLIAMNQVYSETFNYTQAKPFHQSFFRFESDGSAGQFLPMPLLQNFDFSLLSRTYLTWHEFFFYQGGNEFIPNCGVAVCRGFDVQLLLEPNDPHVTITKFDVPEPSTIALLSMALLSLFVSVQRRSNNTYKRTP